MTTARPPLDLPSVKIQLLGDDSGPLYGFCCREKQIDDWAAHCHDHERGHRARVFCAMQPDCSRAYGFYSISLRGEAARGMEGELIKGHNNSGVVPFVYIDFLAVESAYQNQGLGKVLLIDALRRCHIAALNVGFCGVALHSLNERTTALYEKYDFAVARPDLRNRSPLMVLPTQFLFDLFGPEYSTNESGQTKTYVFPAMPPS